MNLKTCENIPLQAEKLEGTRPLVPHRSTPMLCRISQSNMLAKKFVSTEMGISYTKHQAGEAGKA